MGRLPQTPAALRPAGLRPGSVLSFATYAPLLAPRPLSFVLALVCVAGGFPPLVPSSAFVGLAGFGSAVSGRPPVSSTLLRYARAVLGNPPTRAPPCVHGGRGGLSLSFLILTAVCRDEQTFAYSWAVSSAYSSPAHSTCGVVPLVIRLRSFWFVLASSDPDSGCHESTPFGAVHGRGSFAFVFTGVSSGASA